MFLRLTATLQLLLVAGMLLVPGLGAADLCLSERQCCEPATVRPCCCETEGESPRREPCCVTVQREWMLPFKDSIGELSAGVSELPLNVGTEIPGFVPLVVDVATWDSSAPDPPPLRLATRLALFRARLV